MDWDPFKSIKPHFSRARAGQAWEKPDYPTEWGRRLRRHAVDLMNREIGRLEDRQMTAGDWGENKRLQSRISDCEAGITRYSGEPGAAATLAAGGAVVAHGLKSFIAG